MQAKVLSQMEVPVIDPTARKSKLIKTLEQFLNFGGQQRAGARDYRSQRGGSIAGSLDMDAQRRANAWRRNDSLEFNTERRTAAHNTTKASTHDSPRRPRLRYPRPEPTTTRALRTMTNATVARPIATGGTQHGHTPRSMDQTTRQGSVETRITRRAD